jgi:hypothetical protein
MDKVRSTATTYLHWLKVAPAVLQAFFFQAIHKDNTATQERERKLSRAGDGDAGRRQAILHRSHRPRLRTHVQAALEFFRSIRDSTASQTVIV